MLKFFYIKFNMSIPRHSTIIIINITQFFSYIQEALAGCQYFEAICFTLLEMKESLFSFSCSKCNLT